MSQLLQGLKAPLQYTNGSVTRPAYVHNGLPFEADGSLAIDNFGTLIDHYHQGLPFTTFGRLAAEVNGAVVRIGGGAAPFDDVEDIVFGTGAVGHHSCGVPYTVSNQITNGAFTPPIGGMILMPHNFVITADVNDDLDSNNATP